MSRTGQSSIVRSATKRCGACGVSSHGTDRLDGQPTLVVERANGSYLVTSAGMGAGIVQELLDRLAELRLATPSRATVVVPLKEGAVERVK